MSGGSIGISKEPENTGGPMGVRRYEDYEEEEEEEDVWSK